MPYALGSTRTAAPAVWSSVEAGLTVCTATYWRHLKGKCQSFETLNGGLVKPSCSCGCSCRVSIQIAIGGVLGYNPSPRLSLHPHLPQKIVPRRFWQTHGCRQSDSGSSRRQGSKSQLNSKSSRLSRKKGSLLVQQPDMVRHRHDGGVARISITIFS
jgi:hypothetical protein